MRVRIARFFGLAVLLPATLPLFAQQPEGPTGQPASDDPGIPGCLVSFLTLKVGPRI